MTNDATATAATFRRIWDNALGIEANLHRVVFFRKRFRLERPLAGAELRIAADTDLIAALDGVEIDRGQFSDDPTVKSWDRVALPTIGAGEHLLAVQVYFRGVKTSGYAPGLPGLYCACFAADGAEIRFPEPWRTMPDPAFRAGKIEKVTPQLGLTTCCDLRRAIDWASPTTDDRDWREAAEFAPDAALHFRERPAGTHPQLEAFHPGKLVKTGHFRRESHDENASAALRMAQDVCYSSSAMPSAFPATFVTPPGYESSGIWLIADLGGEMAGLVEFEVDAPEGARIDHGHGEHLADGRVRTEIYGRNFADTCFCRAGRNRFQLPFRRIGGRYLELHFSDLGGQPVTIHRIGIRPWVLPLPPAAPCEVPSAEWRELRRRAVRTLELCMHEHYEDCPWREQALYTYDSRWQMLYGYYLWGNHDFAAASLELFAPGQREDGHFRLCAPTRGETVIPIYSLIWAVQLYEHFLHSGSNALFLRCRAAAAKLFAARLADRDAATGLYHPGSPDFWNFYEWAEGLHSRGMPAGELHALYNLYFIEALEAYAKLLESAGESGETYRRSAAELRGRVEKTFYDPARGLYASTCRNGKLGKLFHEHTQVMMLHTRSVPEARRADLWQKIRAREGMVPMTLSCLPYRVLAALDDPGNAADDLETLLLDTYRPMLGPETDTLWETAEGQSAFQFAGSLCHGWSALPVWYLAAAVLGVRPVEAGFRRFRVAPHPGSFSEASGEIVTPAGAIRVQFRRDGDTIRLRIRHPAALVMESDFSHLGGRPEVEVETC